MTLCTGAASLRPKSARSNPRRHSGFSSSSLSTFNCQLSTSFLHLLFHYFFTLAFPSHLFSLTAAVCSNQPTVLHPLSVFSNLCETSYPHPRTGHTQNLTFRPTAKSPI